MAGKAAAPGTAVLLVTANVGSLFDDGCPLQDAHYCPYSERKEKPLPAQKQEAFRAEVGPGFRNVDGFRVKIEKQKQYHKS